MLQTDALRIVNGEPNNRSKHKNASEKQKERATAAREDGGTDGEGRSGD
jgi:hypothetical protein